MVQTDVKRGTGGRTGESGREPRKEGRIRDKEWRRRDVLRGAGRIRERERSGSGDGGVESESQPQPTAAQRSRESGDIA